MSYSWRLPAIAILALPCRAAAAAVAGEGSCGAGGKCSADGGTGYPWPSGRGSMTVGQYSHSPHRAPKNWEKKLAWSFPGARGPHSTIFIGGVAIDDQRNVYAAAIDCIYKLDENGTIVWLYPLATSSIPVLHDGALYTNSKDGRALALDMKKGTLRWERKVNGFVGGDIAGVGVSDGVLVSSFASGHGNGGDDKVTGLNASTGEVLWTYSPEAQLWNFMPMFSGEGTFIFQDQIGGVYHLETASGAVRWKVGYKGFWTESWTDGIAMLGPNRMVYAMHADCTNDVPMKYPQCSSESGGNIAAYRLDTGEKVWSRPTGHSPNSQPLVTRLGKSQKLSVVLPVGHPARVPPTLQVFGWSIPDILKLAISYLTIWLGDRSTLIWGHVPWHSYVEAFDAETGEKQWRFDMPELVTGVSAGDTELLFKRSKANNPQYICIPNLWASPTIDAEGRIFMAHANGMIYSFKDENEDGSVDFATEVVEFDTKVASGHPGPGIAEGMLVQANCDRVLAFKD